MEYRECGDNGILHGAQRYNNNLVSTNDSETLCEKFRNEKFRKVFGAVLTRGHCNDSEQCGDDVFLFVIITFLFVQ
jgi:hypothetical protein